MRDTIAPGPSLADGADPGGILVKVGKGPVPYAIAATISALYAALVQILLETVAGN
ncbi:hypothetical protein TVNIR_3743 [Thioalkalivibrio nitratireducens DSM 14787]|uniref:Uncharacterized protein n=1 Tax=Thioalkalivibrio nitratireducens (strain DSM 14787 / UNIQEM 213 / ALEN2) TaxID=1255043 RepID=L0E3Z6_THIND|nr:hypothetical protein TVNIR_3743 [Thioalkalivibrio nitratireducens DSM 14787]